MYRTSMEFTGERVVPEKTPQTIYDEHIYRYIFAASLARGKTVLDVASGTGYGLAYMVGEGAAWGVGVDLCPEAINYAQERFTSNGRACFICADALRMPFSDSSFDVVVSFETIEHIRKYARFLAECRRVLKESGLFVCSTPNRRVFSPNLPRPINPFHVKEFWADEFYRLLSRYFADVRFYGQCDVRLADNWVDRSDYSVHQFVDDGSRCSGYIIAVARKGTKSRRKCHFPESQ
jgi:ubiquinone/menaquinone biosynthesis C-methylase UbiE